MSTTAPPSEGAALGEKDDHNRSSRRFRFKRERKDRSNVEENKHDYEQSHRKRRHRHHRKKHRKVSDHGRENRFSYDDSTSNLPPDMAFRESLFDALGDDEGAAFWEGVYGQPIHDFPNARTNPETGELEQMNDEEYAQYVRRKMWEKSWEGIEAAKEEKRKNLQEDKQQRQREERARAPRPAPTHADDFMFDFEIEASLRRGERRKEQRHWRTLWEQYLRNWEELKSSEEARKRQAETSEPLILKNEIPWPVESGSRKDVEPEEVEKFVRNAATHANSGAASSTTLASLLKVERIRWHPDKIVQRFGDMAIDPMTIQGVTAVFQVFDRMWNELREQKL